MTPFGVFIFETTNWSGRIVPSTAQGMVTRIGSNRQAEDRRSPLDQNRTKSRSSAPACPQLACDGCGPIHLAAGAARSRPSLGPAFPRGPSSVVAHSPRCLYRVAGD
ncbi:nuclease-related domain-containing protein [Paraburkholderia sp. RL17-337-BIB-A]|uniref:nuclease-related domain-containing protein n=1 Tax=Paraburkholderia sp. RL17-337-BIB-A TaxID=3031636 RepID=UPI0038BB4F50